MLLPALAIVIGFGCLVWGGDRFVTGAAGLARNLGVSTLVIGLTVAGFGTSAPELVVAALAALEGNPGLGVGNALGSNIANAALVAGATAVVTPLAVRSSALRREFPVLVVTMLAVLLLLRDDHLGRLDGALLLAGLAAAVLRVARIGQRSGRDDPLAAELDREAPSPLAPGRALGACAAGLAVLLLGSHSLVWGATRTARALGVSDLVIGLTVVALGTSLPELAASVAGALKKEPDIAIGNIIGSNMFNILGVMAMPAIIAPGPLSPEVLTRDYPVMMVLTLALLAMAWGFRGPGKVSRGQGALLLAAYAGYLGWLFAGR